MAVNISQISQAIVDIRFFINDGATNAKYGNARLVNEIGAAFAGVVEDVNDGLNIGQQRYAYYTFTVDTTNREFMFPTGVGGITRLELFDSTNVRALGYFPAYHMDEIRGPNWVCRPPWIRFDSLFGSAVTVRIVFIPRGQDYLHDGSVTEAAFDASNLLTLKLDTTPTLGDFDPRPNAFVGGMIRIYKSTGSLPANYAVWPWQERYIEGYTMNSASSAVITVNKAWDADFSAIAGTYSYEILPMCEPELMRLAALRAARNICLLEARADRVRTLDALYRDGKTTALRTLTKRNMVVPPSPPNHIDRIGGRRARRFGIVDTGIVSS